MSSAKLWQSSLFSLYINDYVVSKFYNMSSREQLRKLVSDGVELVMHRGVRKMVLEQELTFIEQRHLEDYFIVAHRLIPSLRNNSNYLVGPGRNWTISSHVCRVLEITQFSPGTIGINPLLTWGNEKSNTTIDIEVDNDSYHAVYQKAIEIFGYNKVARMPALLSDKGNLDNHEHIGITPDGDKVYLHSCALLICKDGCIADYYPVQEITDESGIRILCTKVFVGECDDKTVFRFNVLKSSELTKIRRIQQLITSNGKDCPQLYEREIWNENYSEFYNGNYKGIPLCESLIRNKDIIRMQLPNGLYGTYDELLNIIVLHAWGVEQSFKGICDIVDYQTEHGIISRLGENQFPWGFRFTEDVAWFLNGWIGLTWKQTAHVIKLTKIPDQVEIDKMKLIYINNGIDNGFRIDQLNRIWDSIFKRDDSKHLFSKSNLAGELYLTVFLARLKTEYPIEFKQYEKEQK